MELRPLTDTLIELLRTVTGKQVGDSDVPSQSPEFPYCIVLVSPSPGPTRAGDWAQPESESMIDYQVTCVGTTREQAQWMSDKVNLAITGMGPSDFVNPWSPSSCDILDRTTLTIGAIVRTGTSLFEGNDIYRIRIGRKQS